MSEKLTELQNQNAAIVNAANDERDLLNQLLGQAQMADAFGKFSQTVWSSKLAYVKENKLYRSLAGKKSPNGLEFKGTWVEFCNALGVSDEKANQDIANLQAFGEEALESMSRMGIGYREMRQLRRLPDDEKQALIETAKTGDKDSFLDLAEDIISKHAKEKEQLTRERDEFKADYDAQGERLAKVSHERDEAQLESDKLRKRIHTQPADEAEKQLHIETAGILSTVKAGLNNLSAAFAQLIEHADQHNSDQTAFLAGIVKQVELDLIALRDDHNIPDEIGGDQFAWMDTVSDSEVPQQ